MAELWPFIRFFVNKDDKEIVFSRRYMKFWVYRIWRRTGPFKPEFYGELNGPLKLLYSFSSPQRYGSLFKGHA